MKKIYKMIGRNSGFSLTEIVVAMAIIGVAVAIAVPSFVTFGPHKQLKSSTMQIYVAMQGARGKAVGSTGEYGVRFNIDASPVTFQLMTRANSSATWAQDSTSSTVELGKYVTIDSVLVGMTNYSSGVSGVIGFTPLGASTGGIVKLRTGDGDDKFSVTITAITGRVKIENTW